MTAPTLAHLPVAMVLAIYLPAALFGLWYLRDEHALAFLLLLAAFVLIYYAVFPMATRALAHEVLRGAMCALGRRVPWRALAWLAVLVYAAALLVAALSTESTPLAAALNGASLEAIAEARAGFLANRTGPEAMLRYLSVILGRSLLPFLVAWLYWRSHRLRHAALLGLLAGHLFALEKAAPLFVFLPLVMLCMMHGRRLKALLLASLAAACVGIWSALALGVLHTPSATAGTQPAAALAEAERSAADRQADAERRGNPDRHYLPNLVPGGRAVLLIQWRNETLARFLWVVNRVVWIPYITAYDWLAFHQEVLGGRLTWGHQIGVVGRAFGNGRLPLEQMVYRYQFGASPGNAGASNTAFFVDAKLAFGWPGAVLWCVLFTICAAAVLGSSNQAVRAASVTCFFTASVSPLTATLLSGGMAMLIAIALLSDEARPDEPADTLPTPCER